jgi:hypothetical protein
MPKAPPCSQHEPPAHSLVTRKTGTTFCRKKPVRKAKATVTAASPVKKVRKTRSNKGVKRGARRGLKPTAANTNKGKFLVALKFKLKNTRNNNRLNNVNLNGNPLFTEANKNILRKTKVPTKKEISNYMGNENRYTTYLENLYAYGNLGFVPPVKNYKNGTVRYVLEPSTQFPNVKSIKNNLKNSRTGLSNGTWGAGPGSHGVYPVKLSNGSLAELGVINFNNVNVKKL